MEKKQSSAAVPAAVVGASRPHNRGQDGLATAGKMPVLPGVRKPMMLVLSVILGIVPLMGVAWIVLKAGVTSVDGLFMSLILLTLSGILFLNAYIEVRGKLRKSAAPPAQKTS